MFTNAIEWVQDTYELLKETWNDKGLTGNDLDFDLKTHQYPSFTEKYCLINILMRNRSYFLTNTTQD